MEITKIKEHTPETELMNYMILSNHPLIRWYLSQSQYVWITGPDDNMACAMRALFRIEVVAITKSLTEQWFPQMHFMTGQNLSRSEYMVSKSSKQFLSAEA